MPKAQRWCAGSTRSLSRNSAHQLSSDNGQESIRHDTKEPANSGLLADLKRRRTSDECNALPSKPSAMSSIVPLIVVGDFNATMCDACDFSNLQWFRSCESASEWIPEGDRGMSGTTAAESCRLREAVAAGQLVDCRRLIRPCSSCAPFRAGDAVRIVGRCSATNGHEGVINKVHAGGLYSVFSSSSQGEKARICKYVSANLALVDKLVESKRTGPDLAGHTWHGSTKRWPHYGPAIDQSSCRIDYAFVSSSITPSVRSLDCLYNEDWGSDHLPCLLTLDSTAMNSLEHGPRSVLFWNADGLVNRLMDLTSFDRIVAFIHKHAPDVVAIQEVKYPAQPEGMGPSTASDGKARLQHVPRHSGLSGTLREKKRCLDNFEKELSDYVFHFSLSTSCYSGVALFYRKYLVKPTIRFSLALDSDCGRPDHHDSEGRVIIAQWPSAKICNLYVPNRGSYSYGRRPKFEQKRIEWDTKFKMFVEAHADLHTACVD